MLSVQEWGAGDPVIALHPLALESTAFAGVAGVLARHGLRTIAVDLPGFGRTPAPDAPLTAARLAEPVIELARRLETPPVLMGMSMGGRVALEAALTEPTAFRGAAMIAPYLPWRRNRWMLSFARLMSPGAAERVPLDVAWPLLKRVAGAIDSQPRLREDWLMRASARVIYYFSCAATRASFVSAMREMALDPAFGRDGIWTRLRRVELPTAFVWGGRDLLIPGHHAEHVARLLPRARHMRVPCAGHIVNGRHSRCFERAMATAVVGVREDSARPERSRRQPEPQVARCVGTDNYRVAAAATQASGRRERVS
jgi:pimeloyl-ACP methyl ester carboxylesterase